MRIAARPLHNLVTVGITFGAAIVHARYMAPVKYPFFGSSHSGWWTVFAAVQLGVGYGLGLPELALSRLGAMVRAVISVAAAFAAISVFQGLLATPLLPRSSLVVIGLTYPIWTVIAWHLSTDATAWAATRDRVFLVVDRPEDARSFELDLKAAESPVTIVGAATLDEIKSAGTAPLAFTAATELDATILVLDAASQAYGPLVDQAAALHRQGVRVRTLSLFYEEWIGKLPHSELARVSLLFDVGELHRLRYVRAKRAVDLIFAGVGFAVLAPVALIAVVLNPVLNPGPLIYRQSRVGRDGRQFTIFKLRTMRPLSAATGGGDEVDQTWTAENDDRVTALGRVLRRTHLDELPQVINIARGDLSLVGPRPEQPHYVQDLTEKIAFYDVRHIVRPGITGWAQVKQGYASNHDDAFEKLQYDFYYLRRQGVFLDAKIIRRTVGDVLRGAGR